MGSLAGQGTGVLLLGERRGVVLPPRGEQRSPTQSGRRRCAPRLRRAIYFTKGTSETHWAAKPTPSDVRDGYVSVEAALEHYGVVIAERGTGRLCGDRRAPG